MTIDSILKSKQHRDFEYPAARWGFYQEWNDSIFLHWKVNTSDLQPFVPPELEIDLFNDSAYISLVAFNMERIRPRLLPAFAPISTFHEINWRTYVRFRGKPGVYFLNIEASKNFSCWLARNISGLPYRPAHMWRKDGHFSSRNKEQKNDLDLRFDIDPKELVKSNLDLWLTERYALFLDSATGINTFDIHHIPWSLYPVHLQEINLIYPKFAHLVSDSPLAHYSPGVQVIAWNKVHLPR